MLAGDEWLTYTVRFRNGGTAPAAAAPNNTVITTTTGGAKVKGRTNATPPGITAVDILATNGVVHLIDQVLLP